tara:strand:- start:305 stop:445 length:141 start_codon:yes stop_codon:yes gene_type:complete
MQEITHLSWDLLEQLMMLTLLVLVEHLEGLTTVVVEEDLAAFLLVT